MIVLDTTVLAYGVGAEHRFREPCARLLTAIGSGTVRATTTTEVIQEFAHIRARRRSREDAAGLAEDFAGLLEPLLTTDGAALLAGLNMFRRHQRLGSFDAVLIAAAVSAGAVAVVSADAAFDDVPGLRHIVPDDAGITSLLAHPF